MLSGLANGGFGGVSFVISSMDSGSPSESESAWDFVGSQGIIPVLGALELFGARSVYMLDSDLNNQCWWTLYVLLEALHVLLLIGFKSF